MDVVRKTSGPVSWLGSIVNPFTQRVWTPTENPYEALVHDARAHNRSHLPAELLLPGDVVQLNGWTLAVQDAHRASEATVLVFLNLEEFAFTIPHDQLIRTLRRVDRHLLSH